ncbi:MAG: F0F1 ATP synthase subunit B [Acidobacteria bacterium]|nr:F0F1 ATP synthase subunit B [Acidobacteriota bacterium]
MDNPLVRLDPGLFIWTIVTFLVLVTLLAKFAWRPLLEALERRQAAIRKSLDDAEQARQALERATGEAGQVVRKAREEADSIIVRTRADADRLKEELKQQARTEAGSIVQAAQRQIQLEAERARQQLRQEAIDLSVMIASKIINRNVSKEDNARLIEETIRQIERQ